MSSDNSVLEEIIYERINSNYKIIKPKSHTSVYNSVIDLSKSNFILNIVDTIQMYDRRFYHIILVEDQNYKVTIYNYNNKVTKFSQSAGLDSKNNFVQENDFEYDFIVYDWEAGIFSGKKHLSMLSEKNENWWSKYDLQLNDLQKNLKSFKFNNEINFLIYEKNGVVFRPKKKYTGGKSHTSQIKSAGDRSPIITFTSMKTTELISVSSPTANTIAYTKKATSVVSPNRFSEDSYSEKIKNLAKFFDLYFSKYQNNNNPFKIADIIEYVQDSSVLCTSIEKDVNKNLYHTSYIQQLSDWMLLVFNKFFNEENAIFFSIRWLSCNNIPIYNFYRELIKKVIFRYKISHGL
jgi:hypothetical protein